MPAVWMAPPLLSTGARESRTALARRSCFWKAVAGAIPVGFFVELTDVGIGLICGRTEDQTPRHYSNCCPATFFPTGQVQQTAQANCAVRRNTPLGSSSSYPPSIPNTGYEGGLGFLSTNTSISAFANWAVAYLKYCDGGSFTGTRHEPEPARNNSGGPIWYRGKFNLEAQLDLLVTQVGGGHT